MNSEDAKTRRNLTGWIKMFDIIQWTLALALSAPFVWFFFIRTPGVIKEAREIAAQVRGQVGESELAAYLAASEQEIQRGTLPPTNCVPSWVRGIQTSHARLGASSRLAGTNLTITAVWADGRGFIGMNISNDPKAHPERGRRMGKYTVMAWTNCSITVATEGY